MRKNNKMTNLFFLVVTFVATFTGLLLISVSYGPLLSATNQVSNANAAVTVSANCLISVPLSTTFGAVNPGVQVATSTNILDTNNGNIGTYIWVYGGNWMNGASNAFAVSQTDWNPTSLATFGGNALSQTNTNTLVYIGASTSNNVYFGVSVPNGQSAATYNQLVTFTNVCSPTAANQVQTGNLVVTVSSTCEVSLNTYSINFGTLIPGGSTSTSSGVTDTNNGNANTYLWINGGNWMNGATNAFTVADTSYNAVSQVFFNANSLLSIAGANTAELVTPVGTNTLYFGVTVPSGQSAATYNQIITFTNVC